jgi:prevent-host-death family protein
MRNAQPQGRTIGAYEAKTHLARLLDEVAQGETITITKHGVPVAMLVPPPGTTQPDVIELVEGWERYRREQDIRLDGLAIRELIEDGRRS